MSKPRPQCGTYNGYHAHVARGEELCEPCAGARRAYHREYYRATTKIRRPASHFVDAGPAKQAIIEALDRGVILAQIERGTGLSRNALRKIRDGIVTRSRNATVRTIVDVCQTTEAREAKHGFQPTETTKLRLVAIHESGATWRWIAEQLATSQSQLNRLVKDRQESVSTTFARRVEDLMLLIGQGEARAPGMVDRGQLCAEECGAYVDYGTCTRCRKRRQRVRERERAISEE